MNRLIYTMVCSSLLFFATGWTQAYAEFKVGVVNAAALLEKAPQAESARSKLEKEFAPREKILVEAQKRIRKMEDRLNKDGAVMSESERRRMERDLMSEKREYKRTQEEFREDLNIRRNEELAELQRLIYDVIVSLAKQEKYDVIVGDGVIFASDRIDITDKVLDRLRSN